MKKLFSLLLVLALSLSISIPTYAVEPSIDNNYKPISFEEYNKAIENEYAKHHIKYKCTSYNKNFVFTEKLLQQKLNDIN